MFCVGLQITFLGFVVVVVISNVHLVLVPYFRITNGLPLSQCLPSIPRWWQWFPVLLELFSLQFFSSFVLLSMMQLEEAKNSMGGRGEQGISWSCLLLRKKNNVRVWGEKQGLIFYKNNFHDLKKPCWLCVGLLLAPAEHWGVDDGSPCHWMPYF